MAPEAPPPNDETAPLFVFDPAMPAMGMMRAIAAKSVLHEDFSDVAAAS